MVKRDTTVVEIFQADATTKRALPLFVAQVKAGFPSPADDYIDRRLDLNEYLIQHPASTFFVRVQGDSMINAGIHSGSILIVDRSLEAKNNNVVVAVLDGEFTVKRLRKSRGTISLIAENPAFKTVEITKDTEFEIWGVVIHVVHSL